MTARSLRVHLLALILPPIAALLVLGGVVAYFPSLEPATAAYDEALIDIAIALGAHIRVSDGVHRVELPGAVEQVLRTDKHDRIYYQVSDPAGRVIGGDADLPVPAGRIDASAYDAVMRGAPVRVIRLDVPCAEQGCVVRVAETTHKRTRLERDIAAWSLLPELFIALATITIVWFGIKRGLAPLSRLSEEILQRAPADLRPLDVARAPDETRPLVSAMNELLARADEANRNQRRFLANVAHQLRTPLAGLQAHAELALAGALPAATRADLERVREAAVRAARLTQQLLALARAEPGGGRVGALARVDLKTLVEAEANAWVHGAMSRDIDLGFDLAAAPVLGDAVLLREAMANLVHNAIEYAGGAAHVTVRTATRQAGAAARAVFEVEDDGPGIAPEERARVLERFYRVPGTPGTGSGLGLAIVSETAIYHGARIEIGDVPSDRAGRRGCRVTLEFAAAPTVVEQA